MAKIDPLQILLKNSEPRFWRGGPKGVFDAIVLTGTPTLIHYNSKCDTVVCPDSSSFGLGAVLKQKQRSKYLPVAYAARSLTSTEQRYA